MWSRDVVCLKTVSCNVSGRKGKEYSQIINFQFIFIYLVKLIQNHEIHLEEIILCFLFSRPNFYNSYSGPYTPILPIIIKEYHKGVYYYSIDADS